MNARIKTQRNTRQYAALIIKLIALLLSITTFLTACEQSNLLSEQQTEETEITTDELRFSYNGRIYSHREFVNRYKDEEFPLMVTGTSMALANAIYVFDSEANFRTWAQTTSMADELEYARKSIVEVQDSTDQTDAPLLKGSKANGLGGWVVLYDGLFAGINFYAYATSILSSLSHFDKKTTSVQLYNPTNSFATICSIYSLPGFQGSQFIILNQRSNFRYYFNLSAIPGWNNVASSFIVL